MCALYECSVATKTNHSTQTLDSDLSYHKFIEVNFSKFMDGNQIFRIDFVCIHYHLCKISSQII